jgi:hypothetical protein
LSGKIRKKEYEHLIERKVPVPFYSLLKNTDMYLLFSDLKCTGTGTRIILSVPISRLNPQLKIYFLLCIARLTVLTADHFSLVFVAAALNLAIMGKICIITKTFMIVGAASIIFVEP